MEGKFIDLFDLVFITSDYLVIMITYYFEIFRNRFAFCQLQSKTDFGFGLFGLDWSLTTYVGEAFKKM